MEALASHTGPPSPAVLLMMRTADIMFPAWRRAPPGVFLPPNPWSWVDPGAFALIGAGAFMGGVTRLTISLAVIMMEVGGPGLAAGHRPASLVQGVPELLSMQEPVLLRS